VEEIRPLDLMKPGARNQLTIRLVSYSQRKRGATDGLSLLVAKRRWEIVAEYISSKN
jgi:hypothetical protein